NAPRILACVSLVLHVFGTRARTMLLHYSKVVVMLFALFVDRYVWRTALFTPDLPANLQRTDEPRPVDHKVELGRRRVRRLRAQSLPFESRRPFGPGPGALWL